MSRADSYTVARGVWVAPWLTANGEKILVAVNRHGRLAGDPDDALAILGLGAAEIATADRLWDLLDVTDPQPVLALVK